jgi:hypothetical protein
VYRFDAYIGGLGLGLAECARDNWQDVSVERELEGERIRAALTLKGRESTRHEFVTCSTRQLRGAAS